MHECYHHRSVNDLSKDTNTTAHYHLALELLLITVFVVFVQAHDTLSFQNK